MSDEPRSVYPPKWVAHPIEEPSLEGISTGPALNPSARTNPVKTLPRTVTCAACGVSFDITEPERHEDWCLEPVFRKRRGSSAEQDGEGWDVQEIRPRAGVSDASVHE